MRPPISAADLLRAFKAIDPQSDSQKRDIATMLGFDWQPPSTAMQEGAGVTRRRPRAPIDDVTPPPPPIEPSLLPDARTHRTTKTGIRVSTAPPARRPLLDWLSVGPALQAGTLGRAPKPVPLFRPQWTPAILSASLSAREPIGAPDLERAIERIARGEALMLLPRLPILTLARGVQALIDVGDNMEPFSQDRVGLQRDLRRTIGGGSLDLLQCMGSPRQTRRGERSRAWRDYEAHFAPPLDSCVLIVSDFGIGGGRGFERGANPYAWAMLARRLKRAGHRVVGFAPYPPARFPAYLARAVDLVQWDRATTVGRISLARSRRAAA
jgi:hypothetical protein